MASEFKSTGAGYKPVGTLKRVIVMKGRKLEGFLWRVQVPRSCLDIMLWGDTYRPGRPDEV
jgi:hypothetical protein